ncbi:MAG: M48 family metallopeptidase [Deltaproteobacteria bacterium]|nr:M48 family metallopeptidase [Deltaproteobacteria bacterium]
MDKDDDLPLLVGTASPQMLPAAIARAIDEAFLSARPPPRLPLSYVFAVAAVGGSALIAPFLYLLLPISFGIGGILWFVVGLSHIRGIYSMLFVVCPALGFVLAAISLLSPLFRAREISTRVPIVVTRASEPVLFHLIDACARAVQTRAPDEVHFDCDSNAAVVSTQGRTILILGLPVVACLSVRELAGLLSHELGHVRQGFSRRLLLQVVRVHRWFAGAVESALAGAKDAERGYVEAIRDISLAIGLWFLTGVLTVVNALTLFLAREMELDADRYEATVGGSAAFVSTAEKLCAAAVVLDKTIAEAAAGVSACPDNLPRWAAFHVERMPQSLRRRAARRLMRDAAGVPHPPFDVRVANAATVKGAGYALPDVAAVDLFRAFDSYSR